MAREFINRQPDYTDLDLDFFRTTTGDVSVKKGDEAIKRSVRNLIMTNFFERPFRSYIGSNVRGLLFENLDDFTASRIKDAIFDTINNFETRVSLIEVDIKPDYDRNGFEVRLIYVIKNREQPVITSIFLERVR